MNVQYVDDKGSSWNVNGLFLDFEVIGIFLDFHALNLYGLWADSECIGVQLAVSRVQEVDLVDTTLEECQTINRVDGYDLLDAVYVFGLELEG